MRQIYYPLILMIIFCGTLHAQDQGGLNPTKFSVIPPAPNAAGLRMYRMETSLPLQMDRATYGWTAGSIE